MNKRSNLYFPAEVLIDGISAVAQKTAESIKSKLHMLWMVTACVATSYKGLERWIPAIKLISLKGSMLFQRIRLTVPVKTK